MSRRPFLLLLGVLVLLQSLMVLAGITQARADEPQVRTWTDHTGSHETQAVFVRASGSKVTIRTPEGREINIALNRLSKADQEYVREQLGGAGTASGVSTCKTSR